MKQETLYKEIGLNIKGAEESQIFGKPCFKINGKAFCCFFENCMVFKLTGDMHKEALLLKDSILFDPSKTKRLMKEWVQVSFTHKSKWPIYAKAAFEYVKKISK